MQKRSALTAALSGKLPDGVGSDNKGRSHDSSASSPGPAADLTSFPCLGFDVTQPLPTLPEASESSPTDQHQTVAGSAPTADNSLVCDHAQLLAPDAGSSRDG